jgi:hypothetical protein
VQNCDTEKSYLKKLNDTGSQQYQVKITNRFAALETLVDDYDDVDISGAWESVSL